MPALRLLETVFKQPLNAIDMVLWDLQARLFGVPIHKLLGECRDKVKAYANTYPNMGTPEEYADHALECKQRGYKRTRFTRITLLTRTRSSRCQDVPRILRWISPRARPCEKA